LAALLLSEVVFLSLRFDAGTLSDDREWWADLVRQMRFLPQIGIAALIAFLVFKGSLWFDEIQRLISDRTRRHPWVIFLAGHLLAFVGFTRLTAIVLEGSIRDQPHPEAVVLAWIGVGVVVLVLWGVAILPAGLWFVLTKKGLGVFAVFLIVGITALEAGRLATKLWEPSRNWTATSVYWLLQRMGDGAFLDLNPIDDPDEPEVGFLGFPSFPPVKIAPQCSGYEGIGLISVFLICFLWYYRHEIRFPQVLLLFPFGWAAMWLANILRITALIAVGTWISPQLALTGFHSQVGWLSFNVVALGLLYLMRRPPWVYASDTLQETTKGFRTSIPYLAPLFVLLLTMMVTRAFSDTFDWLYPVRLLTTGSVLWIFRRHYQTESWRCSWPAVAIGVGVFILWIGLEQIFTPPVAAVSPWAAEEGLGPGWAAAWLVCRVLGSVVIIPLAEELAFRGYLIRWLVNSEVDRVPHGTFTWLSFVVSSILFGALHSRWIAGSLAGMGYAAALYRRGKIADAVWAHAITNTLISGYVLTTGSWSAWS
jgi:exosortase E/protease (VPEID-CTERM system)